MIASTTVNADLYSRVATHADGAAVRALLGTFPSPFPTDPAYAGKAAVFARPRLKLFAGKGVTFPWLVWAPADIPGDSFEMVDVGGSWWAYVPLNGDERRLADIRSALESLYQQRLAIAGGDLRVTHRGRAIDDAALTATGMETRIAYRTLG